MEEFWGHIGMWEMQAAQGVCQDGGGVSGKIANEMKVWQGQFSLVHINLCNRI